MRWNFKTHHYALRETIGRLIERIFPDPLVKVSGPPLIDVAVRRSADGRLVLHLLNVAQTQRADRFLTADAIPTLGPIDIRMRVETEPKRVAWVPDKRPVSWQWESGLLSVTVPELALHGVIVID